MTLPDMIRRTRFRFFLFCQKPSQRQQRRHAIVIRPYESVLQKNNGHSSFLRRIVIDNNNRHSKI